MATIKDLKNGAVFELELDGSVGYGYVKMIFSRKLGYEVDFDMFIIKIYNVFSEISMKGNFDAKLFETDDLITSPPNMYFRPVLRGKDKWKYIGESKLTEEDYILPDYIDGRGFFETKEDVRDRMKSGIPEAVIHKFMNQRMYTNSYDDIKHLSFWRSQCSEAINRFLSIYWMEKQGVSAKDFYKNYIGKNINKIVKKSETDYYALEQGFNLYAEMTEEFTQMEKKSRLKAIKIEDFHEWLAKNKEFSWLLDVGSTLP